MQTTTAEKTETLRGYAKGISEATGILDSRKLGMIENYMRNCYFNSTHRKGKWVTKLFGVLYWVKAYKKDLWHISDTLVNDIRNRDTYPNRYAKWTYCQNLKKGTSK
jgi:hypothetical protein